MIAPSVDQSPSSARPRLQKVLATAGFGSRRQCEELIVDGRVEIDRQVVTQLGTRVDPLEQQIRVDGVAVKPPRLKCFLLHKPVGVVSTARDPWARTRVIDLVDDPDRLFTVGRLDKSSSGLILVTNDGDLAQRLTHPRYGVEKVYRVVVVGRPTPEVMRQLRAGVHLAEGRARVERVALKNAHGKQSVLEIVLTEGRNREIRRLLARVGHKVQQLKRIAIGPLRLGELPTGAYRELSRQEVAQLRRAADGGKSATRSTTGGHARGGRPGKRQAGGHRKPRSDRPMGPRQGTVLGAERPRSDNSPPKSGTRRQPRSGPRRPAPRK
jgi:23S rRNA pseudouridine2605 synthase